MPPLTTTLTRSHLTQAMDDDEEEDNAIEQYRREKKLKKQQQMAGAGAEKKRKRKGSDDLNEFQKELFGDDDLAMYEQAEKQANKKRKTKESRYPK